MSLEWLFTGEGSMTLCDQSETAKELNPYNENMYHMMENQLKAQDKLIDILLELLDKKD